MELIDKSALVAEIKRLREKTYELYGYSQFDTAYNNVLESIDTLEVKEVKEPTASDRGMAGEIIINLKRVEQDYCINLTKEMEWLRNIVRKGE